MTVAPFEWLVYMEIDVEVSPKRRQFVKKKIASGECLECGRQAVPGRRQLCGSHYNKFRDEKKARSKKERTAYINTRIRNGTLRAPHRGKSDDVASEPQVAKAS